MIAIATYSRVMSDFSPKYCIFVLKTSGFGGHNDFTGD
jgi:hypothetical protein